MSVRLWSFFCIFPAPVVELADTQRSGRCDRKIVEVQVLSGAPEVKDNNIYGENNNGAPEINGWSA